MLHDLQHGNDVPIVHLVSAILDQLQHAAILDGILQLVNLHGRTIHHDVANVVVSLDSVPAQVLGNLVSRHNSTPFICKDIW